MLNFPIFFPLTAFDDNNRASVMNITCYRVGYSQVSNIHKCPSGGVFPGHSATTIPQESEDILVSTVAIEEESHQTVISVDYRSLGGDENQEGGNMDSGEIQVTTNTESSAMHPSIISPTAAVPDRTIISQLIEILWKCKFYYK